MKVKSTSWLFVIMFISTFLGINMDQTYSANQDHEGGQMSVSWKPFSLANWNPERIAAPTPKLNGSSRRLIFLSLTS